jgi:hypothetical protein
MLTVDLTFSDVESASRPGRFTVGGDAGPSRGNNTTFSLATLVTRVWNHVSKQIPCNPVRIDAFFLRAIGGTALSTRREPS